MAQVIISAGHSPMDKGAVFGELVEYDLTQKITDELETLIKDYPKLGYKRIPTGLTLPQKIQWINSSDLTAENNDIAVEVHINDKDGEGSEQGVECWHAERGNNASRELCRLLMKNVCDEAGLKKRTINSEYDHPFRRLGYVHNTTTISALIEVGYMDNPKDKKILTSDSGIKKIAKGLLKGILDYYGLKEGDFDKEPEMKPRFPIHTDPGVDMDMNNPVFKQSAPNIDYSKMYNSRINQNNNVSPQAVFPPNSMTSSENNNSGNMSLEERKEIIQSLFHKVLGRNADPKSMDYYSKSQMSEEALMRLMVESKEHKNLIKAAKNYVSVRDSFNKSKREILELKSQIKDREEEIESLRKYFKNTNTHEKESQIDDNDVLGRDINKVASEEENTVDGDERYFHQSNQNKSNENNYSSGDSSLRKYSLKTVNRPAGPLNAFKKLVLFIGNIFEKEH